MSFLYCLFGLICLGNGCSGSIPKDSPLGLILTEWAAYAYLPMTQRKMVFYWNTAWPMHNLDSGERCLLNGSLNYDTILRLELFCQ